MKIAFNPSTVAALTSPPDNKDITFDLAGHNIFVRGVKFFGTDTQVNIIDNLTSSDSKSALSANMGRYLNLTKTPYNNTSTPSSAPSAFNIEICPASSSWYSSLSIPDSGGGLLIRGHTGTAFNLWLHDISNVWYKLTASGTWKKMDAGYADHAGYLDNTFTVFGVEYNGSQTKTVIPSNFVSLLEEGTSTVSDGTMLITSYASDNGFADSNAVNVPYKRKAIHLWEYIAGKTNALYVTSLGTNGRNLTWTKAGTTNNITVPFATYSSALKSTGDDGNWYNWVYWNGSYFWLKAGTSIYDNNTATLKTAVDYSTMSSYLVDNGNHKETASGTAANAPNAGMLYPSGMYMTRTYADSTMPTSYGNVINVAGGGSGLLLLGWSGSNSTTANIYYRSHRDTSTGGWGSWVTLLATNNYTSILDSRYYTESEVDNLLNKKLDRVNLTTSSWNPRGYNLAADYYYNGGDVSFAVSNGLMHVSIDGNFWQNEGQYRVLDTSDLSGVYNNQTLNLYLSSSDTAWWPIVWGGSSHNNTNNSTGLLYKSYNALTWQTSSLTLYATNMQTGSLKTTGYHYYLFNSDATLRLYAPAAGSTERVYIQAGIDNRLDDYDIYSYGGEQRHSIILNPRGGYVGIGTSNPSYKLHVNGDVGITSLLFLPINGNYQAILMGDDCWLGDCNIGNVIGLSGTGNANAGGIKFGKGGMYIGYNGSNHYASNTSVWSSFNADLLDGQHASDFASSSHNHDGRYAISENYGGFTRTGRLPISGFYQSYGDTSGGNSPWTSWMHLINCQHSNTANNYALQIAASFYDNNTFKIRVTNGSVDNSWRDIIHSANWSSYIPNADNYYWANIKISTTSNSQTLPSVNTIYANNWFRSQGNTGWYNENYGGGIYMSDSSWIRTWGNKSFYCDLLIYSSNSIRMSDIYLQNSNEINTSSGTLFLNYRNGGNLRLCDSGGNVGIGISPSYRLHVNGTVGISSKLYLVGTDGKYHHQPVCVACGYCYDGPSYSGYRTQIVNCSTTAYVTLVNSSGLYRIYFPNLSNNLFKREYMCAQITAAPTGVDTRGVTDARGWLGNYNGYICLNVWSSDDDSLNPTSFYFAIWTWV